MEWGSMDASQQAALRSLRAGEPRPPASPDGRPAKKAQRGRSMVV